MRRLSILLFALLAFASIASGQTTGPATSLAPTVTAVRDPVTNNWKLVTQEKAPGAPTAALAGAGIGLVDNGAHQYRVTFVTAAGQTSSGTVSSTVTVVDKTINGKVSLSSIPTGSAFVTSRKIYRTAAGGGVFKLLTTLADNTTTTYTDNTADASLTTNAPTANTTSNTVILYTGSTGVVGVYRLRNLLLKGDIDGRTYDVLYTQRLQLQVNSASLGKVYVGGEFVSPTNAGIELTAPGSADDENTGRTLGDFVTADADASLLNVFWESN